MVLTACVFSANFRFLCFKSSSILELKGYFSRVTRDKSPKLEEQKLSELQVAGITLHLLYGTAQQIEGFTSFHCFVIQEYTMCCRTKTTVGFSYFFKSCLVYVACR